MLGDHNLASDPDCKKLKFSKLCSPDRIKVKVEKAIVHESYSEDKSNNIALIRLKELVPLHNEDPVNSVVEPVCLPWDKGKGKFISERIFSLK